MCPRPDVYRLSGPEGIYTLSFSNEILPDWGGSCKLAGWHQFWWWPKCVIGSPVSHSTAPASCSKHFILSNNCSLLSDRTRHCGFGERERDVIPRVPAQCCVFCSFEYFCRGSFFYNIEMCIDYYANFSVMEYSYAETRDIMVGYYTLVQSLRKKTADYQRLLTGN